MHRLLIFLTASALPFACALWVYLGVRRKDAARTGALLGAIVLFAGLTAHTLAVALGWNTTFKTYGAMGMGTGILLLSLGGMFLDHRSADGNTGA